MSKTCNEPVCAHRTKASGSGELRCSFFVEDLTPREAAGDIVGLSLERMVGEWAAR